MNEQGLIPCESWQYIRGAHAFRHSTQEYSIFPFISLSPLLFLLPLPQPSQRIYPTYTPHNSSRIEFIHYSNAEKPPNENELPEQAWATRLAWLRCSSAPLRWPQHAHCLIAYRGCDSGRGQWSTWDRGIQGRGMGRGSAAAWILYDKWTSRLEAYLSKSCLRPTWRMSNVSLLSTQLGGAHSHEQGNGRDHFFLIVLGAVFINFH